MSCSWIVILLLMILPIANLSAQCTMVCRGALNISLNQEGIAIIKAQNLLISSANCGGPFLLSLTDNQGNIYSDTLNCDLVGTTIIATVVDSITGNFCSTNIQIFDNIFPFLQTQDTVMLCNQSTHPDKTGYPVFWDNCSSLTQSDLSYTDNEIDLPCLAIINGDTLTARIERTWSIADQSANTTTSIQNIYIKRTTLNDVDFPVDRDGQDSSYLVCNVDDPNDFAITGYPSVNGISIQNGAACELYVFSNDQIINECGGTKRIFREWSVIDECTNQVKKHVQIIRVLDTIPPVITCPSDTIIGTDNTSCGASFNLPVVTASDDCSGVTVTPVWEFGTGYGIYNNIPVGVHRLTYIATDDCGNIDSCSIQLTVMDDDAPVAICSQNLSTTISDQGELSLPASVFDSGSYDNCAITKMEVSNDGINFDNFVSFDCNDYLNNNPATVFFRVYDANDLFSQCEVQVSLMDNIAPVITCPVDITIACTQSFTNLNLTGRATATDNCSIDTIFYNDNISLNNCGNGIVTRTWTAIDLAGKSSTCIQMISIEDQTPISIAYPSIYETNICGADISPDITGRPVISGDDCEDLDVSFEDVFYYSSSSCYQIVRKWTIVDWCNYNPNDPQTKGIWENNQLIDVTDVLAPVLTCPENVEAFDISIDCSGAIVNLPDLLVSDCDTNVIITNDSPFAYSAGANASGVYPEGVHTVNFVATDGCGNRSTCSIQITVVDGAAPVARVYPFISVPLAADGSITITPEMFNAGSFDNCTAKEDLIFEVSPKTFNCLQRREHTILFTVIDQAGNRSETTAVVSIQDNLRHCPRRQVSGKALNMNGQVINDLAIKLTGDSLGSVYTNAGGIYVFDSLFQGDHYELKAERDTNYLNGVSTFDIVLIGQHILGLKSLDSPYKIIAADVNNSRSISGSDIIMIRKLILGKIDKFPNNKSWRFVNNNYTFSNPTNPLVEDIPQSIVIDSLTEDILDADFRAMKIGDVNGNAITSNFSRSTLRNARELIQLTAKDQFLKAGQSYTIAITANEMMNILGYQFTIEFDTQSLSFESLGEQFFEEMDAANFGLNKAKEGLITTSWANPLEIAIPKDEVLFELNFTAKKDTRWSSVIKFNSKITSAEAYSNDLEILDIDLSFEKEQENNLPEGKQNPPPSELEDELKEASPNPFQYQTKIEFYLAEAGTASISIFSIDGKLLKQYQKEFPKGLNHMMLQRNDLNLANVNTLLICTLQTPRGKLLTKKILAIER